MRTIEQSDNLPAKFYKIWSETINGIEIVRQTINGNPGMYAEIFSGRAYSILKECNSKRESARILRKKLENLRDNEWIPSSEATPEQMKAQIQLQDELVGKIYNKLYAIWTQLDNWDILQSRLIEAHRAQRELDRAEREAAAAAAA